MYLDPETQQSFRILGLLCKKVCSLRMYRPAFWAPVMNELDTVVELHAALVMTAMPLAGQSARTRFVINNWGIRTHHIFPNNDCSYRLHPKIQHPVKRFSALYLRISPIVKKVF